MEMLEADGSTQGKQKYPAALLAPEEAPNGKEFTKLLITFGLAAVITGILTVASDLLKGWQSAHEQRCSIAQQVVLDESPSPALNAVQRSRLSARALRKVETCMGEIG